MDGRTSYAYCSPIVIEQAGKRVLIVWTGNNVFGLDPQTGAIYWQHPMVPKGKDAQGIATPVFYGNRLFVSSRYGGSLMLDVIPDRLAVEEVWRRKGPNPKKTDSIHCMLSTPILMGAYIYGVDTFGELRCLDADTGDRIWEDLSAVPRAETSNIHLVRNHDKVWMFNERGELLITTLSPQGLNISSRAKLIEPTLGQFDSRGGVCWSHPAFAYKHVFARNDKELVCASLAK
jgi:outer membrane protein assembly factor BamB